MFKTFSYNVTSFFPKVLPRQVTELYLSVAIMDLAMAMVMIFEPIYLYTLGFSLKQILLFYLSVYLFYFFIMPLGAKFARHFGYEHSIYLSTPFLIFYYLTLLALSYNSSFIYLAIPFLACQKTFYWPGYHADFARFSTQEERGREISNLMVISSLVYVLGPFLGGLIITLVGFKAIFILVSILILVSNLPLLTSPEVFTPVSFSYKKAYKRLIRSGNRRKLLAYIGSGEELIVLVVWPIFIYLIIKNYFSIGSIIALTTLITILVTLYVGKITDKKRKHPILRYGTIFSSLAWFLRLLVSGTWGVFLVDSLSRISKNVIHVPLMAITYERARASSVMKTIVFFQMSLVVGKILASVLVILLLIIFPGSFAPAFIAAGLFTLLYGFL